MSARANLVTPGRDASLAGVNVSELAEAVKAADIDAESPLDGAATLLHQLKIRAADALARSPPPTPAAPPPAAASPSTSSTDRWFDQRATVSVKVFSVGAPSDGAPSDGLGGDALAQLEDERALTRQLRARLTAEQDWRRQFLHQASAHPSWLAAAKAGADALDATAAAADELPRADAAPLPPPPLPPPLDAPLTLEATPVVAHSHKLSPRVVGGELESIAFATPAAVVGAPGAPYHHQHAFAPPPPAAYTPAAYAPAAYVPAAYAGYGAIPVG